MAYCPKCNGEIGERAKVCRYCGYDFPSEPDPALGRNGIAYSAWAEFALIIGAFVAVLGCLGSVIGSVVAVFSGRLLQGFVFGPVAFFYSLAMLVVFIRIQKL